MKGFHALLGSLFVAVTTDAEVVSQWRFDGNLDDTAPAGASVDNLTDNAGGVTYVPGVPGLGGQAVVITKPANGSHKLSAASSDDLNLASNWTLEAFIWRDTDNNPGDEWERLWTKWGEGSNDWHWAVRGSTNELVPDGLDLFMNGGQVFDHDATAPLATARIPFETWKHVALIGDQAANTITGWVNGTQVISVPYVAPVPGVSAMNFGNFGTGGQQGLQFSGYLDETRIHDVAVDQAYLNSRVALLTPDDPDGDPDMDGLTNQEEADLGTDPDDADTDGDTLLDGVETATGVWNGPEDTGTSPLLADTDGDGLNDNVEDPSESFLNLEQPGTDPNLADSDEDGIGDRSEIEAGTDPNDPTDFPSSVVVSRWSFENNLEDTATSGANADDLTAAALAGPLSVTYVPGLVGSAVQVSGDPGDATVLSAPDSDDLDLAPAFTIEAFVYRTHEHGAEWERFATKWFDGSNQWHWAFRVPPDRSQDFFMNGVQQINQGDVTADVELEQWYHVAVTGDPASGLRLWQNGAVVGTAPYVAPADGTDAFRIGNAAPGQTSLQFAGWVDEFLIHEGAVSEAYLQSRVRKLGGPRLRLTDLSRDPATGNLSISWESQGGSLYNLRSSLDLAGDPASWPIYDNQEDIAATPPQNTVSFPFPADAERYFVVEEFPAPPVAIFSEDFENGQGQWTTGSDGVPGTEWELGTPATPGPDAANSPDNCFATNLAANYAGEADVWLRSPVIDLTTAGSATLNYFQWLDIEPMFDAGSVSILDAADDSTLATIAGPIEGTSIGWEAASVAIPADALGKEVKIEFRFTSDDLMEFPGWYLDDVEVTVP